MCSHEDGLTTRVVHTDLVFFVNGKKVVERAADPACTLLHYLRRRLRLCGAKYGCGEGGCGACTVMLSKYRRDRQRVVHVAVNACLTPVCSIHGQAVTTVEGIGSTITRLHPVQERIAKAHGSQCGFCTPGIVMSMYALLRSHVGIQYEDIEKALQGNLCRCTGYRPIIESFKTFIEGWEAKYLSNGFIEKSNLCAMGKDCCKNNSPNDKIYEKEHESSQQLFDSNTFKPYDPTQEPIFPPELKLDEELDRQYLIFRNEFVTWYRPTSLHELIIIKHKFPNSKIVAGNTEVGVEIKFKKFSYPVLVNPSLVQEMNNMSVHECFLDVGASVTLAELEAFLKLQISTFPSHEVRVFTTILKMLHWFAGAQIRNMASIGGNIMTASPISDLNPILMSCGAVLNIYSFSDGKRKVKIDESFFISYRTTAIKANEIVVSVEIPFTHQLQYVKAYKQARRREDDISIVTGAFNVEFNLTSNQIDKLNICFGGVGPTTFYAKKTSELLVGFSLDQKTVNKAFECLLNEIKLDSSAPGGMPQYRKSLCLGMFFKFLLELNVELPNGWNIPKNYTITKQDLNNVIPNSSQYYEINSGQRKLTDSVGMPVPHASALKQATGEAVYCDDMPTVEGELFLCLKFSSKSHAKIVSINASNALAVKGVHAFFCSKDLNVEQNKGVNDEDIFATEFVSSYGDVVGAIVAVDEATARKAVDLIEVVYEDMHPTIITLEDAISHKSYYPGYPKTIEKGNVNEALQEADFVIEGQSRNGAQEHFYLETNCCFAISKEDEIEIYCSSQHPTELAHMVSKVLGIPNHKVCAKVKRIGGGFGGKESRPAILALPVAIAAFKLRRPVRAVMDRDEDMQSTGHRHPHLIKYKVAFQNDGRITGAVFDIYNNAGCTLDLSGAVNERASAHVDNCCNIPNVQVNGYVCKTNLPSNTAFRGFGAPQAMLATEIMVRDVARNLGRSYEEIMSLNLYKEGDLTHCNQLLKYCTLDRCWQECIEMANYFKRKDDVDTYNRQSRWKKKGLSIVPTKYGISFGIDFLMQGGALVLIYTDGSILLSIGGIEMGQGLFTKMIQVASRSLEVDISKIHISETATDKVPNSSPTAASISSDLYGMAVVDACTILVKRLEPYKAKNPQGQWEDWVLAAHLDRVSLSATGFYAAPKIHYNWETNTGNLYEYYTYGVACSEVIIDCLTGDHQVLRTDIVMDLGESLNPAIDIGQVEGAFMQGYGFYTMEELVFSPKGALYSKGPGTYKIPGFGDIPKEFNVSLLKGAPNPRAVYSSKAVGEPPLFLASSVFFAIKEAISAARRDAGVDPHFRLEAPATCARIRMACEDHITSLVGPADSNHEPWNVVP